MTHGEYAMQELVTLYRGRKLVACVYMLSTVGADYAAQVADCNRVDYQFGPELVCVSGDGFRETLSARRAAAQSSANFCRCAAR